jgi:predicted dehydrogenase
MERVRWGLLSTARINHRLIPAIRESARGELVAVASRDQERVDAYARHWDIPQAFGSYQAMLDSGAVDAVYISLPNHLHAEWTIRALRSGVHVLCEKPFALSLAEVDSMAATAEETGMVLAEAFMYRHHPQTKMVGEWARSGRLGDVLIVRGSFHFYIHDREDAHENVRMALEKGGGCLWDVGVYPLSFAQYVMGGPPEWVVGSQWIGETGVDEVFVGQLHYSNGRTAQITASFRTPFLTWAEVIGTQGRLSLDCPFVPGFEDQTCQVLYRGLEGGDELVDVPVKSLYLGEVEDMHAAILDGEDPYLTLAESRNHVRTVLALYRSAQSGQPVAVTDIT